MTGAPAKDGPPFSPRLQRLLDLVLSGQAPNAGLFCGHCYHPLERGQLRCPNCGAAIRDVPPVQRIPREVLEMFRAQRFREALVVRGMAYGGLLLGIVMSLMPIALADVHWWTVLAMFLVLAFSYVFFANLANSVGDALGYRWGQSVLRRRWQRFQAQRAAGN
ncbi:MAG TPA: zinc ribbon domain-containing protein [Dehalococcoidia bacterium]|nr:zinc ribbon domain-containing protein [Dehalococcoidia bacterium]